MANNHLHKDLSLFVTQTKNFPPLLGRRWLDILIPNWRGDMLAVAELNEVKHVKSPSEITAESNSLVMKLQQEFSTCFKKDLSPIIGFEANIVLNEGAIPILHKDYSVSYSMKERIESEIDRLVKEKVWEPVSYSEWPTPLVPVEHPNGKIRLCADYKVTLNSDKNLSLSPT
jgi:hypothetical protein